MTATPTATPSAAFIEGRARADRARGQDQERAVRTVAGHAHDPGDFTTLLAMLGLADTRRQMSLGLALSLYVRQVATSLGVPVEATAHEVTDTATAYLALDHRSPLRPHHDLMLVWDERLGWYLAAETAPSEAPEVVAYLAGTTVPAPEQVARFVSDTADGRGGSRIRPVLPPTDRAVLAATMAAVC